MRVRSLALILILVGILVASWYREGLIIGGGEESLTFVNPTRTAEYYKYTWEENTVGGPQLISLPRYPWFAGLGLLSDLGISVSLLQLATFFILLVISGWSMFWLIRQIKEDDQAGVLGAIFYLLNPFMFAAIWHRYLLAMSFMMALLPLSVLLFYKAVTTGRYRYLTIFAIANFGLSTSFGLPSNIITFWVVLGLFYIAFIVSRSNWRQKIRATGWFLIFLIVWVMISAWWLVPLNNHAVGLYTNIFSTEQNLGVLRSISSHFNLLNNLTLGYPGLFADWQIYVMSVLVLGLLLGMFKLRNRLWLNFLLMLFGVSLFILNGANQPTGVFLEWLFTKSAFVQAFRNPYEKFGIVLVLGYALLFGNLIYLLKTRFKLAGLMMGLLLILVVLVPPWTGYVFGGPEYNVYTFPPADYEQMNQQLNADSQEFRVLQMPLLPGDGLSYRWPNQYFGYSPNIYLFDKPSLDKIVRQKNQDIYWWLIREGSYNGNLGEILKYSNVKYLVVHKDLDSDYAQSDDYQTATNYLSRQLMSDPLADQVICQNQAGQADYTSRRVEVLCEVGNELNDDGFLTLTVVANAIGELEIDLIADAGQHLIFDGRVDELYAIKAPQIGQPVVLDLDVRIPTYLYPKYQPDQVRQIAVRFYPEVEVDDQINFDLTSLMVNPGQSVNRQDWQLLNSTPNLDLYQLREELFRPLIYPVGGLVMIDDWYELRGRSSLPEAFVIEDQLGGQIDPRYQATQVPKIDFKKLNNTRYQLRVDQFDDPFWLVFAESYHPGWELRQGEVVMAHFPVNGFANGFLVTRSGDLVLEYRPQRLADQMKWLSMMIGGLVLVGGVICWSRKVKH